jgi:iron complex outermembrane receptor protein
MHLLFRAASAVAIATAFAPSIASAADKPAADTLAVAADAPAAEPDGASTVGEIIVTGTRLTGLRAADSPAPVEVLDSATLQRTGEPNLIQALAQNVPSFNAQGFGGNTANLTLSTQLRGLSPNDALVLINGKRRHGTGNLSVNSSPFQGGASADLSFIPLAAVDHIEVLEDGAAAQYGTDAIGGVVNIILKNKGAGGSVVLTGGQYIDGGGKTGDASFNIGISPTDKSYLNLTFESKYHGGSFRGDLDPRVVTTPYNATTTSTLSANPQVANLANYPYLNRIAGDAANRVNVGSFNAGYDLGSNAELYSFGTYGHKYGDSLQNYRLPNLIVGKNGIEAAPNGFTPEISIDEDDYAITSGIRGGTPKTLTWDLSTTYGEDDIGVNVLNALNRSLYIDTSTATTNGFSPTNFHVGDFTSTQWTTNLDLTHDFNVGLATPLTTAFGAEYRHETYDIGAGDAASRYKEGSQAYPGFALTDAGDHSRDNVGAYVDLATSPVTKLKVDAALRYEHFSDAGDTTVAKLTGRYDFSDWFGVRGTASTGFRAPTLAEEYYSATNVSPTSAFVQLPPNSAAAKLIGIDGLKPEKSTNYSVGFVAHAPNGITATLDAYQISIDDRIVGSGQLFGSGGGVNIAAVRAAILANGNILDPTVIQTGITIFTNGLDTRTRGAELVVTYDSNFGSYGAVNWSLTGNYNETTVTHINAPPAQLAGASLFDAASLSQLTTASPKYRIGAGAIWTLGKFAVNLKENLYGPSSVVTLGLDHIYYRNTITVKAITDLEASYRLTQKVTLAAGANNLFNVYPNKLNPALRQSYLANNSTGYVGQYQTQSPFGIDGGYYYGRVSVKF